MTAAAHGSVPEDGGEALRREVERLLREGKTRMLAAGFRDDDYECYGVVQARDLRAALSAAPVGGRSQDEQEQPPDG